MAIIGLTGSLKTGKSTAAKFFKDCGAVVIDADKIVHESIQRRGKCFTKVVKIFGKEILSKGEIDRKKLGQIVFHDPKQLVKLEKIIHPVVVGEIKAAIKSYRRKQAKKVLVLDVPLLIESGLDKLVDVTVVVAAKQRLQIQRAVQQLHVSPQQALKRIQAQMPLKEKIQWADCVIENNGTIPNLRKKVHSIWQKVQQMKRK
jgi:dephospho-CoA kinase